MNSDVTRNGKQDAGTEIPFIFKGASTIPTKTANVFNATEACIPAPGPTNPGWCSGVITLRADFCCLMFNRDLAQPTSTQFRHMLLEFCFETRLIHREEFVLNVALMKGVVTSGASVIH
jgi:hypothetical protein